MEILISIIIPVYKVEKELPRCMESVINQTYSNIEIILVDDGSKDICSQMCDRYADEDLRVKVIHKENGGLSDARNCGLQQAAGEYILFLDSDDYIEQDSCEKFVEIIKAVKVDIVVGEAIRVSEKTSKILGHSNLERGKIYKSKEYVERSIQKNEWFAPTWLNLYKKSFLVENKLFFKKDLLHEDMEILPRIFLREATVTYLPYQFYHYMIRENSITQNNKSKVNAEHLFLIYKEWENIFDKESDENLQKLLYGSLLKHYLHTSREYQLVKKNSKLFKMQFLLKNSLNFKELLKGLLYKTFPEMYIKL